MGKPSPKATALDRKCRRRQQHARAFRSLVLSAALHQLVASMGVVGEASVWAQLGLPADTPPANVADGVIHRHTGPVGSRMPKRPAGSVVSGDTDG